MPDSPQPNVIDVVAQALDESISEFVELRHAGDPAASPHEAARVAVEALTAAGLLSTRLNAADELATLRRQLWDIYGHRPDIYWDDLLLVETIRQERTRLQALADRRVAELERLRAELPEVQCPSCGATIRARMSDAEGRARDKAAVSAIPAITRIRQGATRAGHVLVSPDDLAVLDRLIHAYRAHREVGPGACCDLHGRSCEPPSELCCRGCTEAAHPLHADGSACSNPDLSAEAR